MISAIFSIPLFGPQNCKIDFLHVCDLGTTSDFLGSLLYFLMEFVVSGNSRREKCVTLFREIDAFYRANNSENRLPKLVPTMLRAELHGKLKSPKLRAKAGEARVLVPCAVLSTTCGEVFGYICACAKHDDSCMPSLEQHV